MEPDPVVPRFIGLECSMGRYSRRRTLVEHLEDDTSLPSLGQRPGALKKRLVASATGHSSGILYFASLDISIPSVTSKFLVLSMNEPGINLCTQEADCTDQPVFHTPTSLHRRQTCSPLASHLNFLRGNSLHPARVFASRSFSRRRVPALAKVNYRTSLSL